jgi:glycosyltransferase involved in cell wall biosynthesis
MSKLVLRLNTKLSTGYSAPMSESPQPGRNTIRTKVVHVVVAGDIGGAERLIVDIASRPQQSRADHCIALMTPNPRLRALFLEAGLKIRDRGPVRENPLAYLWRSFGPADASWLVSTLREERADIVHLHTFGSHVIGVRAALKLGLPVVRTEHGIRHFLDVTCWPFEPWAIRRTDRILAVSEFVADFVAKSAPYARGKVQTVRNGVDTDYFRPAGPPDDGPFTFAVVCRLDAVKRVDLAIRALENLPDARLLIVGDGSERPSLEALARKLRLGNRVRFAGYQSDPRSFIAKAHAVLNCRAVEPLGLSLLEAQAMARPVIAISGGGVSEIVQDNRTGWLVAESAVDGLAAAMAAAAADRGRCVAMGGSARKFVEQECSIETMCQRYAEIYEDLVAHRARRSAGMSPAVDR